MTVGRVFPSVLKEPEILSILDTQSTVNRGTNIFREFRTTWVWKTFFEKATTMKGTMSQPVWITGVVG